MRKEMISKASVQSQQWFRTKTNLSRRPYKIQSSRHRLMLKRKLRRMQRIR
jgi:hypothetical protein